MGQSFSLKIEAANEALIVRADPNAVSRFFTSDYVAHLTGYDLTGGHAAIQRVMSMYQRAFSDFRVDVEILVKSKDRVAWQRTLRAMHTGSYQSFPATGRPLVWRDMVISRFRDGLIAEEWLVTDLAEQLLRARKQ